MISRPKRIMSLSTSLARTDSDSYIFLRIDYSSIASLILASFYPHSPIHSCATPLCSTCACLASCSRVSPNSGVVASQCKAIVFWEWKYTMCCYQHFYYYIQRIKSVRDFREHLFSKFHSFHSRFHYSVTHRARQMSLKVQGFYHAKQKIKFDNLCMV